jgi:hypothetical protein
MKRKKKAVDNLVDENDVKEADSVMGVDNLSQNIFDAMGAKSENLKGAFGRPIDTTGRNVQYGGIGEPKRHKPRWDE